MRTATSVSAFRPVRELPVSGATGGPAELQGRPHPGDDVPVRPAVPAGKQSARALGRGRVSVPGRARSQLHQAAGRPARRDDSHLPRRRLRQAAGRRHVTCWPASRCGTKPRCRSPSTTTDTSREPSAASPNGSAGRASNGDWDADRTGGQPVPDERKRRERMGRAAVPSISCPSPTSGTPCSTIETLPRAPRATLVTDFYSYNTNMMARIIESCSTKSSPTKAVEDAWMQPHWVGDLTLQADLEVQQRGPGGSVRLELDQGGGRSSLHDRPGDRDARS